MSFVVRTVHPPMLMDGVPPILTDHDGLND